MADKFAFKTDDYVNSLPYGTRFGISEAKAAGADVNLSRLHALTKLKDNPIEKIQRGVGRNRLVFSKVK